ncbi:hypothetical protein LINGRAPRIM_LOCUS251 [Linum grandiflorum]
MLLEKQKNEMKRYEAWRVYGALMVSSRTRSYAWKEDMGAGNLLASFFDLFGERIFSFTPKPELSFFL